MTKDEFLKKHDLTEADYRNLQRFERVRKSGIYNMYEYFGMMKRNNLNGGRKMADFILKDDNYGDFLKTLEKENKNRSKKMKKNTVGYDGKRNEIYHENSDGYWEKWEYNEKGNVIYYENSNGYWAKWEYNEKGNVIYYENSNGYWFKGEYDEKGEAIYYENSNGKIIGERVKELTIEEIEKLLGYKIKIKGERK